MTLFLNISVGVITEEVLHSRYLEHVKRESRSYVNQVTKEEQVEQHTEEQEVDEVAVGEQEEEIRQGEQWTAELREQLWQEKVHVEEKLRCIQDEHFYELLQVGWSSKIYQHYSFISLGAMAGETTWKQRDSRFSERRTCALQKHFEG